MIAFIDEHRDVYGVEPICRVLPIAPSTYHEHAARRADPETQSARARRDADLMPEIRRVLAANFGVYGVAQGLAAAQPRRDRGCALHGGAADAADGPRGRRSRQAVRTTISDKAARLARCDRVNRQFRAPRPNALWVSDFTYVATWSGFVYVAFVIDAFARRIVGWRVSRTAHAELRARCPGAGSA